MPTKVHIILPNRIGDSILTLPSLLCLNTLLNRYQDRSFDINVYSHFPITKLFNALDLDRLKFNFFDISSKFRSWINPPDKAFFLSTTTRNLGHHSKISYGLHIPNKKLLRYTVNLPYLHVSMTDKLLPKELLDFLKNNFTLPTYSLRHFGICLELGFSVEQIVESFEFNINKLSPDYRQIASAPLLTNDYVVFCMEAAYNRRHASHRRWHLDGFFFLADKLYTDHGIESVFLGLADQPKLPDNSYMKDMRKKPTLGQIVDIIHHSRGFIGNDSGLLHIANLLRKKSLGLYATSADGEYWPLFPELNKFFINTQPPEEVYPFISDLIT
jgi:ADP-heptose:LPS heptosyltransferase